MVRTKALGKANLIFYTIVALVAGGCLVAFRSDLAQISFAPVWAARNSVAFAASLSLLNYLLRIVRWRMYLMRFGYRFSWVFVALTYLAGFAFKLSPGNVGEMVRARYYGAAGLSVANTTAAFFVERLLDLLVVLALALVAYAASSRFDALLWGTVAVVMVILLVLGCVPWAACLAMGERRPGNQTAIKGALLWLLRTMMAARTLLSPGLLTCGFLLGVGGWGAECLGLMSIGAMAPSVPMDLASATGIYAVAIVVGALSFLPGGLGSGELVMVALLSHHGYSMPDALLLTMVCRLLTIWFAVALGWGAVFVLRYFPVNSTATEVRHHFA